MSTKGKALGDYAFASIEYFHKNKRNNADGELLLTVLESLKKENDEIRALNS